MALRWKMSAKETGLRSIGAQARSHNLYLDGEEVATVYPNGGGWQSRQNGWYWVATGEPKIKYLNTCNSPIDDLAEAKKQARTYVEKCLKA